MNNCENGLENLYHTGITSDDPASSLTTSGVPCRTGAVTVDLAGPTSPAAGPSAIRMEVDEDDVEMGEPREDELERTNQGGGQGHEERTEMIMKEDGKGRFSRMCPNCGEWVGLGNSKGSQYTFGRHFLSEKCNDKAESKIREAELRETVAAFNVQQSGARGNIPPAERALSAPPSPSKDNREARARFNVITRGGRDPDNSDSDSVDWRVDTRAAQALAGGDARVNGCPGVLLLWPLESIYETYPWQVHSVDSPLNVEWTFIAVKGHGNSFWIRSNSCTARSLVENEPCLPCNRVNKHPKLETLRRRAAEDPQAHTPHGYLNNRQLRDLLELRAEQLRSANLTVSSQSNREVFGLS